MKVIFCLPGSKFSGRFLECWTNLVTYCIQQGIQFGISRRESCNIYYVRNMCLGADVMRGKDQKPFNGQVDYDFIVWLDSDSVFAPEHVQRLLNHNVDIVAGLQMMEGGKGFTCSKWDDEFFQKNGYMEFYTPESIKEAEKDENGLVSVDYSGFGLMTIKKGVFERMEYPWFRAELTQYDNGVQDICMEDVYFCKTAKALGFKVHVDPAVRVGHEKMVVW